MIGAESTKRLSLDQCILVMGFRIRRMQYVPSRFLKPKIEGGMTILMMVLLLSICSLRANAQNKDYTQLCNEIQFARTINDKWGAELWLGSCFSNTPTNSKFLSTNIQKYIFGWVHYYHSPRWKFSASLAYLNNKDVPDIGQYYSPEWRLTLQGTYYFHKLGYTLSTRMRGELRYIMNEEGVFEDKYRYRQMIKYLRPLNSKVLKKGTIYGFTDDEIFLKPNAKTSGLNFFDRNRFDIGGGYLFTENIQVELAYSNEFLPRDNGNEIYNAINLTLTFNNFISNAKRILSKSPAEEPTD
jgi:hypothetical protein